jgi:hypothetical protein
MEESTLPELPSLALARLIVKNYRNDDFSLIIIDGNLRVGKSSYAIKAMSQAMDYLFGKPIETMRDLRWLMGWNPDEVVDVWMACDERQPAYIWDDAGYWLHSMNWNDPTMISIQKYFNVVGTDYNTVILTTPSPKWVLKKIASMPEMIRIKCTKRTGGRQDSDFIKFARVAKGYKSWDSPDLKRGGVNTVLEDQYSCKLPQELYDEYLPVRQKYAREAKLAIVRNLNRRREIEELEELKRMKQIRNLRKEILGDAAITTQQVSK